MAKEFGELKVLERLNDYEFAVSLRIMRSGLNRNRWDYQNVDKYYLSFAGQPILCAFPNGRVGLGHEMEEKTDEQGETYYSFVGADSEKIVGTISENEEDISLVEEDGETWVVAKGRLFAFYAKELVDYIVEKGSMEVSAETEVYESHMDGDIEVFTKWAALGVTCLGAGVAPAIPGARIQEFAALSEEFKEVCLKAAAYKADKVQEEEKVNEPEATEPINKPHYLNNNAKESVKMTKFNKKQVAELASKFEGYTVLAAGSDENGIHVCLMSDDGTTATYTMDSLEDTVAPEKIVKVNAQIAFTGSDWEIAVDAYEIVEDLVVKSVKVNADLDKAQADLKEANDKIEQMVKNEMNRRVSAAKETAADTLAKFNANRVSPVADSVLDSIMASIDNGEFSKFENENGEWIGAEEVKTKVLASCAADVMEKDAAEANAHKKQFVWEGIKGNSSFDRGDVASLLDQLDI